jgi:hypothetical protein
MNAGLTCLVHDNQQSFVGGFGRSQGPNSCQDEGLTQQPSAIAERVEYTDRL